MHREVRLFTVVGWLLAGVVLAAVVAEIVLRLARRESGAPVLAGLRHETSSLGDLAGRDVALALGDSITYGHSLEYSQAWPHILEQGLGTGTAAPIAVVNAGAEGQTSVMALRDAPWLLSRFRPRVVLISFGLNDGNLSRSHLDDDRETQAVPPPWLRALRQSRLLRAAESRLRRWIHRRRLIEGRLLDNRLEPRVSPGNLRRALTELVRLARRAGASSVWLLTMTPLSAGFASGENPEIVSRLGQSYARCNQEIREAARASGAGLIAVDREFVASPETVELDGVHLTAAGEAQLAGIVLRALEAGAVTGTGAR